MKRAQFHFFIPIFFCYFYATRGGDAPQKIFACPPRPGVRMITHADPAEIVGGGRVSGGGNGGICRQRY